MTVANPPWWQQKFCVQCNIFVCSDEEIATWNDSSNLFQEKSKNIKIFSKYQINSRQLLSLG